VILTAKHDVVVAAVLVVGRTIAWKTIGASLDDTMFGGDSVRGDVFVVLFHADGLPEEQRLQVPESRLTTKHGVGGGGGVLSVSARKASNASVHDTGFSGGHGDVLAVVLGRVQFRLKKRR